MKHVYENNDGERIAADTLLEAATYLECTLGGAAEPDLQDWSEIEDDDLIEVDISDTSTPNVVERPAREWAAEHSEPGYVSSTYA